MADNLRLDDPAEVGAEGGIRARWRSRRRRRTWRCWSGSS